MRKLEPLLLLTVAALAVWLSHAADPDRGLIGGSIGAALGLTLAGVSHYFARRSASAQGAAAVTAVLQGVIFCFVALVVAIFVAYAQWPKYLKTFALSAVSVYVVHRFSAGVGANSRIPAPERSAARSSLATEEDPASSGGPAGVDRPGEVQ